MKVGRGIPASTEQRTDVRTFCISYRCRLDIGPKIRADWIHFKTPSKRDTSFLTEIFVGVKMNMNDDGKNEANIYNHCKQEN